MTEQRITSFLTILQIVKAFMNERSEKSLTNMERYLQICIEGFSQLSIYNLNSINVSYIAVNPDTNVAVLPSDFISMTKIGVNVNGRLWTLTVNDDILMPRPETICQVEPETITTTADFGSLGGLWFYPFWFNGAYGAVYGISGGINEAYYRIDEKNGVILFNGKVRNDEIILEYISSGVSSGGSPIPRAAAPALKAYLHYKTIAYDTRYSLSERDLRKREYEMEAHALSLLSYSFSRDEFLDTMREGLSQAPKR